LTRLFRAIKCPPALSGRARERASRVEPPRELVPPPSFPVRASFVDSKESRAPPADCDTAPRRSHFAIGPIASSEASFGDRDESFRARKEAGPPKVVWPFCSPAPPPPRTSVLLSRPDLFRKRTFLPFREMLLSPTPPTPLSQESPITFFSLPEF